VAIAELIIASSAVAVPLIAFPLDNVRLVPLRLVGSLVPIIVIGRLKFVGRVLLPPPLKKKWPLAEPLPLVFIVTGEVKLVWPLLVELED
jgi:hypothetical protein